MASSTRVTFPNKLLPYLLLAPQLAITAIFFYWPASQAIYQSVLREDPFGLSTQFVGLDNFRRVISDPNYVNSLQVTVIFSVATALIAMALALLLAVMADKVIRGKDIYQDIADLALCSCASHRWHALALPVQSINGNAGLPRPLGRI